MRAKQTGFTLIELVIVIVILGILAATALPRFVNLQADARNAKIRGLEGGLRGAAAIAHATFLARNLAGNANITMEGQAVTMCNGYPTADAAGIGTATQLVATDWVFTPGGAADTATFTVDEIGDTSTGCRVVYTAAADNGGAGGTCIAPGNAPTITFTATCI